jgi:hypothetical protein
VGGDPTAPPCAGPAPLQDAQRILSRAHETSNPRITQQKIDFLHLPIIDGNVTTDSAMNRRGPCRQAPTPPGVQAAGCSFPPAAQLI